MRLSRRALLQLIPLSAAAATVAASLKSFRLSHVITALEIAEGGRIPRGYAVAYWRQWSDVAVCYPIGLHWLVSAARVAYQRLCRARFEEEWEVIRRVRFEIGREQGRREGYHTALRHDSLLVEVIREQRARGHA